MRHWSTGVLALSLVIGLAGCGGAVRSPNAPRADLVKYVLGAPPAPAPVTGDSTPAEPAKADPPAPAQAAQADPLPVQPAQAEAAPAESPNPPPAEPPSAESPPAEPPAPAAPPPPAEPRVAVLMYHHLAPPGERSEEPGVITPERFESHLELLAAEGYHYITADQFAAFLDGATALPERSVLLTFDDGYESNYSLAFPLMKRYAAPGLIFPVMKYFGSGGAGAWSPHLTRDEAREMLASGLIAFGAHTYDGHGNVATGEGGTAWAPWLSARAWLPAAKRLETEAEYRGRVAEDLKRAVGELRSIGVAGERLHFAMPNGAYLPEGLDELRQAGFRYLYTTDGSQLNRPGIPLIFRLDAGGPHASQDWLRNVLAQRFQH